MSVYISDFIFTADVGQVAAGVDNGFDGNYAGYELRTQDLMTSTHAPTHRQAASIHSLPLPTAGGRAARRFVATAVLLAGVALAGGADRPNILLIFADDLGWKDVGYNGSDFHETPNIDRLAHEGMVFTHGYSGAGNCTPSRACLISGQYSSRHGVYAVGNTDRGPRELMRLVPVPNRRSLAAENITIAGALKAAGYRTGIFGKWHLDSGPATQPGDQGFDVVHESKAGWPGRTAASDNPKGIDSLTAAAIDFMRADRERPFFAYLSHYAVHTVYQARPETIAKFKTKPAGTQHNHPVYSACLYDLDASIGRLMEELRRLGLERNTLVVFTSDNGSNFSPEPLRGRKGSYYEGGIRVPFIARWPGVIRPRTSSDVPVINQDLYPTFLAVAGATAPPGKILDGESLLPLFRGARALSRRSISGISRVTWTVRCHGDATLCFARGPSP